MSKGKTAGLARALGLSGSRNPNPNGSNSARRRNQVVNETGVDVTFPASWESQGMGQTLLGRQREHGGRGESATECAWADARF